MDQVRTALAWMKRYHFWLLTVISTLVGVGSWYFASSALAADFEKNRKRIQDELSSSSRLRNTPYHANDRINKRQRAENRVLAEKVRELWSRLHERQQAEVLKWPRQLGDDFVSLVEGRQFGEPIPRSLRQRYQNYIEKFYPELPKTVDAPQAEGDLRSGGLSPRAGDFAAGAPRRASAGEQDHLMTWDDQTYIREQLNLETTPSSLRIWVTQEDLWVYVTLLRAIAAVNEAAGADRYANAAVRDINVLEVGKPAAKRESTSGRIERPDSSSGGVGDDFIDGGGGEDFTGAGDDIDFTGNSGGDASEELVLLSGRYIDDEGKPMPATEGDYEFGTEFKRLPVRLSLRMDQRWMPHLISELSNAPLQVEVTEVRINPESDGIGGRGGGRRSRTFGSGSENVFPSEPNVVQLVLRGTVYIYNPVDEEVLAIDDSDA